MLILFDDKGVIGVDADDMCVFRIAGKGYLSGVGSSL